MDAWRAYGKHVNPGLSAFLELTGRDLRLVRGRGVTLEEAGGRRYDDWVSGFGSLNLGHNPPAIRAALRAQLDSEAPNLFVENLNSASGALAERLIGLSGPAFETVFFSNSGSEAVEAAIKTALRATGKPSIAYASGGYHGTTLGALSCMAKGLFRDDFEQSLLDFHEVDFGDLGGLDRVLSRGDVGAFLIEPIQVEAGVRIAGDDYLTGVRELCDRRGALLIFDEIQTGMGRTGTLFAWQGAKVTPDLFVLAKSLGGGVMPIGATVIGSGLWSRAFDGYRRAEIHNSTFGGNALACRAALATLEIVADAAFLDRVRVTGAELFAELGRRIGGSPVVERLSGRGLLGGLRVREGKHPWLQAESLGMKEFEGRPAAGALLVERLARKHILAQVCAHDWSVLRIEPPLIVDAAACARFVEALEESVRWLEENA